MPRKPGARRPVVLPLAAGLALSVAGTACTGKDVKSEDPPPEQPTSNPPAPPPDPPEERTTNPPGPPSDEKPKPEPQGDGAAELPTWEAVESGHPEGATNPPVPVLLVQADGERCWKSWSDPRRVDREVHAKGGRVLEGEAQAEGATEIQCPDNASTVLAKHAELQAAEAPEGGD